MLRVTLRVTADGSFMLAKLRVVSCSTCDVVKVLAGDIVAKPLVS